MEILARRRAFSTDCLLDPAPIGHSRVQINSEGRVTMASTANHRSRWSAGSDQYLATSGGELAYLKKIADLELTVVNLKCQLMQASESRRPSLDDEVELGSFRAIRPPGLDVQESFLATAYERGSWLASLLVFQSFSSFILVANEGLLAKHPDIIFFLTMLVGAGGNAGNQAAVRVIRGLAVGSITARNRSKFLRSEVGMAVALSCSVGLVGFLRALLSFRTSTMETVAITLALVSIIFISIITGAVLPFVLQYFKFDPAHSSTSIQVIMDILGVLITCFVATSILDMSDIASVFVGSTNPTQRGDVSHHTPLVNAAGAF